MEHIAIPTIKGQVTIPRDLRLKYDISKKTPISFEDQGCGILVVKILEAIPPEKQDRYKEEREQREFERAIDSSDWGALEKFYKEP